MHFIETMKNDRKRFFFLSKLDYNIKGYYTLLKQNRLFNSHKDDFQSEILSWWMWLVKVNPKWYLWSSNSGKKTIFSVGNQWKWIVVSFNNVIQNKATDQMFLVEDNQTPRGLIFFRLASSKRISFFSYLY